MGFLKRLFSIGGKNKKKAPKIVHNVPLPEPYEAVITTTINEEENEAAIGRLLRSSSSRYAVASGLDYADIPPMPHPINNVVQTPAASTVSLASTTISSRGTYNVTVHRRTRHASTEFPFANRDLEPSTPERCNTTHLKANDSRVLGLRSDPSVASLISLYDEHGRLPAKAFSNSPPSPERVGKAQCKRNGSTLRQLLGAPTSLSSRNGSEDVSSEGDISWAERFLGETDTSSTHSLELATPRTPDGMFTHDISFATELSENISENPAISSMDVELSISTNASQIFDVSGNNMNPYSNSDPTTPQRASQVFGFLTKKRMSKIIADDERPLPELPSAFSSPSSDGACREEFRSHFSEDSCESAFAREKISAIPIPGDTTRNSHPLSEQLEPTSFQFGRPISQETQRFSFNLPTANNHQHSTQNNIESETVQNEIQDVKVLMTGPTKVILTAPTPSATHVSSRIPRGPRAPPRKRSASSINRSNERQRRSTLMERSNTTDRYGDVPSRRRASHHRSSSLRSTSTVSLNENDHPNRRSNEEKPHGHHNEKDNCTTLAVKPDIPMTPLRSHNSNNNSRSLFRTVVHQGTFRPPVGMTPSPASSSEMSPLGRQIMMDVRKQRMKARETERERSGLYGIAKRSGSGAGKSGLSNGF